MRIWDISPNKLCDKHLLGEHRELHAIWVIITQNKKGYSNHPETKRWRGKLKALYNKHQEIVLEMERRGFNHFSFLDIKLATGKDKQDVYIDSIKNQIFLLKNKKCNCRI